MERIAAEENRSGNRHDYNDCEQRESNDAENASSASGSFGLRFL
jgi:hypothetical protein